MSATVLRDPNVARQYLMQGLWFQRILSPNAAGTAAALHWCLALAESGQPLPPAGFIADVGNLALCRVANRRTVRDIASIAWPSGMARSYEDVILGPTFSDSLFERAGAAIRRLGAEHRPRGIAYLLRQVRENARFDGVELPPGIVRGLLQTKPEELLRHGWESIKLAGPMPMIIDLYRQVTSTAMRASRLLADEDVIALEHQTALLPLAQYIAHRQILQTARRLEEDLPRLPPAPSHSAREAPTRLRDDDAYPVGGYASISNRGSIESLLHSQLAYMEPDRTQRPDLFDIKFLRDELHYYSRDENRFLRKRRSFLFVLHPDLTAARFKDADLPFQRSVLVLASILVACRKLTEWLSMDGLCFEFLFLDLPNHPRLDEELRLLQLLFREQLENGTARIERLDAETLRRHLREREETMQARTLVIQAHEAEGKEPSETELLVNGPRPELRLQNAPAAPHRDLAAFEHWSAMLNRLLETWI